MRAELLGIDKIKEGAASLEDSAFGGASLSISA
jgi:hypothetical protein